MTLEVMPDAFAICRLAANAPLPDWATRAFSSITRTPDELSIVCASGMVPPAIMAERDFRGLKVRGPLDFDLVGIVARLSASLAAASISIFVVSTHETDYLFVREADLDRALTVLRGAGHVIAAAH